MVDVGTKVCVGIAAILLLVQQFFAEHILVQFLPSSNKATFLALQQSDKNVKILNKAYGIAFLHATIVAPLSIYEGLRLQGDSFDQVSPLFDFLCLIMMSYFLWDVIECLRHYHLHGAAFLIHSICSFFGTRMQYMAITGKMPAIVSLLAGTEISTPFLHIRWILIKGNCTKTIYFKTIALLTMSLFIGYRVIYLPFWIIPDMVKAMFSPRGMVEISTARRTALLSLLILWVLTNYMWTYKFILSYLKKRNSTSNEAAAHSHTE